MPWLAHGVVPPIPDSPGARRGLQLQRLPVLQPGDVGGGLPLRLALQPHPSALQHAVLTGDPPTGDPGCHCTKKRERLRKRRRRKAPLRGRARGDPHCPREALPRTSTTKSLRVSVPGPCARQVYRPWWKGCRGLSWSWPPSDTRPCSGLLSARRRGEGDCSGTPPPSCPQARCHALPFRSPGPRFGDLIKAEIWALQSGVFAPCIAGALQEKRATDLGAKPHPRRVAQGLAPR